MSGAISESTVESAAVDRLASLDLGGAPRPGNRTGYAGRGRISRARLISSSITSAAVPPSAVAEVYMFRRPEAEPRWILKRLYEIPTEVYGRRTLTPTEDESTSLAIKHDVPVGVRINAHGLAHLRHEA